MTPKDPFWRGLSGTNSGGRFAPGRFCSLPIFFASWISTVNLANYFVLCWGTSRRSFGPNDKLIS